MSTESKPRVYRKGRRAELEAETRERIAKAAMELHGSIGPARTTISEVATRAGVQRGTVYRHFPDEEALFAACSAHWYSLHPPPDAEPWMAIADPDERLQTALADLYEWYASDVDMFTNIFRDAAVVPAMAQAVAVRQTRFDQMLELLLKGRRERGAKRSRTAAVMGHAIGFPAWRSLVVEGGLTHDEAIDIMVAAVGAASR